MPYLYLRPTVIACDRLENDFQVIFESRGVGRIRFVHERATPGWDWTINPSLPILPYCKGTADTLENAKTAFRDAWVQFYMSLTPTDIAHWRHALLQRRRAEANET